MARFLLGASLLLAATAALTIHLTARAVEERVQVELRQTAALLGGSGFPLNAQSLARVAEYLDAELVALNAQGRVLAASPGAPPFVAPAGPLPREAQVAAGEVEGVRYTLGVAPVPGSAPEAPAGAIYVLYPEDLVARQARSAWLPVTGVALLGVLLAGLLGILGERAVQRERTAALLHLLASVAHEVRNPLGAIRSLAGSLRRRIEGPRGEPLELIAAEAERLTLLVEGLRTVGLPVRRLRREILPEREVRAVLRLVEHQLRHRRVELQDGLACPEARLLADPAQLRQVVLNLLLNAADAMPRGGRVRCSSWVEEGEAGPRWFLAVEDDGPGVAPEVRQRLFEPFFTTKPKGLGVGLTTSRRLVDAHGGSLGLDPTYEAGARFVLAWPAVAGEPAPRLAPAREP